MIAHMTDEQWVDFQICVGALAVLAVARFALYLWDTRNDFDRPKKHGGMK
jgi:hypothetical protein